MNKKYVLILVIVVSIASALLYQEILKTQNTSTVNNLTKVSLTDNPKKQNTPSTNSKNILNLSNQNLDKLPADVVNMSNLEELDISGNKISGALPAEIRNLSKLKVLIATNNQMTGIPAEVGQLQNLEILNLSNNKLTGLPNELGNLKKLKVLDLSGNDYSKQDLEVIKKGLSPTVEIII